MSASGDPRWLRRAVAGSEVQKTAMAMREVLLSPHGASIRTQYSRRWRLRSAESRKFGGLLIISLDSGEK